MNLIDRIKGLLADPARAYQISGILRYAGPVLTGIILAYSSLKMEEIGKLEWIFYLVYVSTVAWYPALSQDLLRRTFIDENDRSNAYSDTFGRILVYSGLIGGLFILFGIFTSQLEYVYLGLLIPAQCYIGILPQIWYHEGRINILYIFQIFHLATYVAALLILMAFGADLMAVLQLIFIFHLVSLAGCMVFGGLRPTFSNPFHIKPTEMGLIKIAVLAGLALSVDGLLVRFFTDEEGTFAIYRYGAREFPLALLLTASVGQAFYPMLSRDFATGVLALRKRNTTLMHLTFPVYFFVLIFSNTLFFYLYQDRFEASVILFDITILLVLVRWFNPQHLLIVLGEDKYLMQATIVEISLNILLSMYLFLQFGLIGIVSATLLAFLVEKGILALFLYKKRRVAVGVYHNWRIYTLYSVLLIIAFVIKYKDTIFF